MNIGSKLILSFLLATLLPTVFLAFLTTNLISSSKKEDAQETINNNLKAAWMQYYARAYQMQYGMLQASTERYLQEAVKRRDTALLREQIIEWKKFRPYVDLWSVVDSRGYSIASHNTPEKGYELAINGLVKKAIGQKKSFISTEIIPHSVLKTERIEALSAIRVDGNATDGREIKDGMMLVVVTPVVDPSGAVLGAFVTGDLINNDQFVPDTLAESIPGSLVTIAMGDVQIATNVLDERGARTVGHLLPKDVIEGIRASLAYRGETEIAGKEYVAAFDPIINYEAKIIGSIFVGVPKEKFVELQYRNIKAVTTIALIGFFMATGVASFITYVITRPILSLKKKAELVSEGDLNVRIGSAKEGRDEIADLARAFDLMVRSLRDKEESIKTSQDKLFTQKALIESIINSLPYCLYVLERSKAIVVWNRHASEACPICKCNEPGGDCHNENFMAHTPDELRVELERLVDRVFETGKARSIEYKLYGPDGSEMAILTNIFPVLTVAKGPAEYVVWMSEDVTKKKALEKNIISSEKLAAVGQLAAGIAHEVNNPLGGILNCLYNFKNRNLTDERKAEYLDFMEDGIKRVQNIVRQLLDFSQQHAPALTLTDINAMIQGIIPLFVHSVKGRDVRLVVNLGEGLAPILVDKHQIEQILVNLILNAVQALEGDGLIEVSTRHDGRWFCIQVSDNGCGIVPENLTRIFDPFFTTKGVGKGTGLGLSVSRGIIERHNGRIEVTSQPGKGSIFKVLLPIQTGLS